MDLGLNGKSAILSAASQGLGKACAQSLAAEGVSLTLNARTEDRLEATAAGIRADFGVEVRTVAGDFAEAETRENLLKANPAPDIVVNNPGIRQVPDPFDKIDGAAWRYWMEVHFLSSVEFIQAVAPGMRTRRFGQIVNMSVSFIKFPQVGFAHTHAARLALSGATAAMPCASPAGTTGCGPRRSAPAPSTPT